MTHAELIATHILRVKDEIKRDHAWGLLHASAWKKPQSVEAPIVGLVTNLARFADEYARKNGRAVAAHADLAKAWHNAVNATRGLLESDLGRLDRAALDGLLTAMLEKEGYQDA